MLEAEVSVQPITVSGYIGLGHVSSVLSITESGNIVVTGLTHGISALSIFITESGNIGLTHVGSGSKCPAYNCIRLHRVRTRK